MKLIHRPSGQEAEADIEWVTHEELARLDKSKRFGFRWLLEKEYEVYKVYLIKDQTVVGLMSLEDIEKELRLEVRLIENSLENQGRNKVLDRIAGCLLAFACQVAFERGYGGFVSLIPKTELVEHYKHKYGFRPTGIRLFVEGDAARTLIKKYL